MKKEEARRCATRAPKEAFELWTAYEYRPGWWAAFCPQCKQSIYMNSESEAVKAWLKEHKCDHG